jgi:hypothetical protein
VDVVVQQLSQQVNTLTARLTQKDAEIASLKTDIAGLKTADGKKQLFLGPTSFSPNPAPHQQHPHHCFPLRPLLFSICSHNGFRFSYIFIYTFIFYDFVKCTFVKF